jgi:hypothetical protein
MPNPSAACVVLAEYNAGIIVRTGAQPQPNCDSGNGAVEFNKEIFDGVILNGPAFQA